MRVEERVAGIWGARGCGTLSDRRTDSGEPGFVGLTERRGGDEPELGWNRAGAGLEPGWSGAGAGGAGRAGRVGLELSAPQEASGSSQRPVVRSSPRKSRPGGRGQALLRAPPSHSPAPSEARGRKGGGGRPCGRSAPQPWPAAREGREGHGEPGVATYRASKPRVQETKTREKGERGKGSKLKDTSSSSKTHATNDTLKSLGPKS